MEKQDLSFFQLEAGDMPRLLAVIKMLGYQKELEYLEQCFERQNQGDMTIVLVVFEGVDVGYCMMNWAPKYSFFKVHELPEIQDLNILQAYRQRGIGRAVIKYCEGLARDKGCQEMGIGVGLDASYGAAQRLYIKMGYVPDGQGISYDRKQIAHGEFRPVDDQLCLMMTKKLD